VAEALILSRMKLILGLWLFLLVLLLLSRSISQLTDVWVGFFTILLSLPITAVLFWRRRTHRRGFRDLYLNPDSYWYGWLKGGVVMLLIQAAVSIVLAMLLLIGLLRIEARPFWILLVAIVPVWVLSHDWFKARVSGHVSERFGRLVTDRIHGAMHGALLLIVLLVWALYQSVPDLDGVSLEAAIRRYAWTPGIVSGALQAGLSLTGALTALPQWLVQNPGELLPGALWKLLAWTFVLVREWLFVWPLVLAFQGLHGILDGGIANRFKEAGFDRPCTSIHQ
jgi:hypothetical protein